LYVSVTTHFQISPPDIVIVTNLSMVNLLVMNEVSDWVVVSGYW
jgi:ATP-dependent helicase YprA (DUF1998 family)